jgi:hypothetical protein
VASHSSCGLYDSMTSETSLILRVRRFVLVRSAIVFLRAGSRNRSRVVIGGVDVVPGPWAILPLPCIPRTVRGRPR